MHWAGGRIHPGHVATSLALIYILIVWSNNKEFYLAAGNEINYRNSDVCREKTGDL